MNFLFLLFSSLGLFAAGVYAWLILRLVRVWQALPVGQIPPGFEPAVTISVIIPARNEAARIGACLQSVLQQHYPPNLFEVIVIDDHSEDDTAAAVYRFSAPNLRLLHLADCPKLDPGAGYKKQAIAWAIEQAKGELIVTTDADCLAPPAWLLYFAHCFQEEKAHFIAGPVAFHRERNLLERFQSLDYLGMMLITGAGIEEGNLNLSNGASLAYPKAAFEAVGGFATHQHLASGDDMLLMHQVARRFPGSVRFIKAASATVLTQAKPDLRSFVRQRLRWASKSAFYPNRRVWLVQVLVFLLCWSILLCLPAGLCGGWPSLIVGFGLFLIKCVADYYLLRTAALFFHRPDLLRSFFPAQLLHILYIAGIGLLANVQKKYTWKDRKVG